MSSSSSSSSSSSGFVPDDITYTLNVTSVDHSYINFDLIAQGEMWTNFDICFEYRLNDRSEFLSDAVITQTTAKYLRGNKLYGLSASKNGISNTIIWKYADNGLFYSNVPQIRIKVLPRIRVFSSAGTYKNISSLYGDALINFDGQSRHTCIGINKSGYYMCVGSDVFYVIDSLDAEEFSSSSSTEIRSSSSSSS
jgi:hypothetical protein